MIRRSRLRKDVQVPFLCCDEDGTRAREPLFSVSSLALYKGTRVYNGEREVRTPSLTVEDSAVTRPIAFLTRPNFLVSNTRFVVGIDAGGSKTHVLGRGVEGSVEHRGPGANPNRIGTEESARVLNRLLRTALRDSPPVDQILVCAGVSGAGRSAIQKTLADALRAVPDNSSTTVQVEVVHDALIALDAAYDAESGVVVIAGTGSVVLGRTESGTLHRAGGWGHVLGDPGSGYGIGQAGLQAVAEAFDGGLDTALRPRIRKFCDVRNREQLLRRVYQDDFRVQSIAPLVIEAASDDDSVASRILVSEAEGLVDQFEWVLRRADGMRRQLTLLGGMIQNESYEQLLRQILGNRFPDWSVQVLDTDPVVGAVRRAERLDPTLSEAS